MKKILLITLLFLSFNSCKAQKNSIKLKTIDNNHFKLKYPNSWVKFGAFGHVNLTPKKIKKAFPEDEKNYISVNKNLIYAEKFVGIEKTLDVHGSNLFRSEKSKKHTLVKINNHSLYIYKIESTFQYLNDTNNYKRVEFFYTTNGRLDYIRFQMREDLFDNYFEEAMLIINSFEPKTGKLKKYKSKNYWISYPETWERFNWHNAINFAPKQFKQEKVNKLNNNVFIFVYKKEDIKGLKLVDVVNQNIDNLKKSYSDVKYEIKELTSDNGNMYYVELTKESNGKKWREISTFYLVKDNVYLINYSFREEIYLRYLEDAKLILKSIEFKM